MMYTEWVYGAFKGDDDKDLMWAQYDAYRNDRIAGFLFRTARQAVYDAKNKRGYGIDVPLLAKAKDIQSFPKKALWSTCDAVAAYYRYCHGNSVDPIISKDKSLWKNILRKQYVLYFKEEAAQLCASVPFAKQVVVSVAMDFEDEGHQARLAIQELLDERYGNAYWAKRRPQGDLFKKELGYIYVLANPSMPGLVKIGRTSRDPSLRASELASTTGVPSKFLVVYQSWALSSKAAEEAIHRKLESLRYSLNREFFKVSIQQAIETVDEVVEDVNTRVAA